MADALRPGSRGDSEASDWDLDAFPEFRTARDEKHGAASAAAAAPPVLVVRSPARPLDRASPPARAPAPWPTRSPPRRSTKQWLAERGGSRTDGVRSDAAVVRRRGRHGVAREDR